MVFRDGTPKGLEIVLRERGVNTDGLNKSTMVEKLQQFDDFKHEKNRVQIYLEERHHKCMFNPKVYNSVSNCAHM